MSIVPLTTRSTRKCPNKKRRRFSLDYCHFLWKRRWNCPCPQRLEIMKRAGVKYQIKSGVKYHYFWGWGRPEASGWDTFLVCNISRLNRSYFDCCAIVLNGMKKIPAETTEIWNHTTAQPANANRCIYRAVCWNGGHSANQRRDSHGWNRPTTAQTGGWKDSIVESSNLLSWPGSPRRVGGRLSCLSDTSSSIPRTWALKSKMWVLLKNQGFPGIRRGNIRNQCLGTYFQ